MPNGAFVKVSSFTADAGAAALLRQSLTRFAPSEGRRKAPREHSFTRFEDRHYHTNYRGENACLKKCKIGRMKTSIKCYARTKFPARPTYAGRWDLRPFVSLIRVFCKTNIFSR